MVKLSCPETINHPPERSCTYDTMGRVRLVETDGLGTTGSSLSIKYGWNVTSFTDNQGRTELVRFNHRGQPLSVQDAMGRASYGTYLDEQGKKSKLTSLSDKQKTSVNRLTNGNVSDISGWIAEQAGVTGSVSHGRSTTEGFMGEDSLFLTKENGEGRLSFGQTVNVSAGKTYTFSAYVKGAEGAELLIQIPQGEGWTDGVRESAFIGPEEWNRTSLTYTVPAGVSKIKTVILLPDGVFGSVWADCLQLEEGELSRYNLLTNSDFTEGTTAWSGTALSVGDSVGTVPAGGTHPGMLDSSGFHITGDLSLEKSVSQVVKIAGKAGDSFVYGGWLKATFGYDTAKGLLTQLTDPLGNHTAYTYDIISRPTGAAVTDSTGTPLASVAYGYTGDTLSSITRNGMSYGLSTDAFGNTVEVSAAGTALITNTYNYSRGLLTKSTYGNGRLYRTRDEKTGVTSQYDYDLSGKLMRVAGSDDTSYRYYYDGKDNLSGIRQTAGGKTWTVSYGYDSQYRPITTKLENGKTVTNTYDSLSRLTKITYGLSSAYTVTLGYGAGANGGQSTQLSSYQNGSESVYQYHVNT